MVHRRDDLFSDVSYRKKTSDELRTAMTRKRAEVTSLSKTREGRILKIREEYGIDAELLSRLVMQFRRDENAGVNYGQKYQNQNQNYNHQPGAAVIPAGVIAALIREQEMIESERDQVRKLDLVLRNLRDTEPYFATDTGEHRERTCIHELSDFELEYLGF